MIFFKEFERFFYAALEFVWQIQGLKKIKLKYTTER